MRVCCYLNCIIHVLGRSCSALSALGIYGSQGFLGQFQYLSPFRLLSELPIAVSRFLISMPDPSPATTSRGMGTHVWTVLWAPWSATRAPPSGHLTCYTPGGRGRHSEHNVGTSPSGSQLTQKFHYSVHRVCQPLQVSLVSPEATSRPRKTGQGTNGRRFCNLPVRCCAVLPDDSSEPFYPLPLV